MPKFLITGILIVAVAAGCNTKKQTTGENNPATGTEVDNTSVGRTGSGGEKSVAIYLTEQTFKDKVFNYDENKEWKYEGTKPAVIDFYADWCAPCRQLSPVLEEVAREYGDKIILYKVDTEKETELTRILGIEALPTLLYIPLEGKPQVRLGAAPKEALKQAIDEILPSE